MSDAPRIGARALLAAGLILATTAPAMAQSAGSRIDQPTAGTLPPGTSTVEGTSASGRATDGKTPPPSAIQSSTDVMRSDGSGSAKGASNRTNPVQHLPEDMR